MLEGLLGQTAWALATILY